MGTNSYSRLDRNIMLGEQVREARGRGGDGHVGFGRASVRYGRHCAQRGRTGFPCSVAPLTATDEHAT